MRKDKIVYSICIGDIQEVAEDELDRKLTDDEMKKVIDKMGDYLNWSDSISYSLEALDLKSKEED